MANAFYNDTVISKRFESILSTKLNLQQFLTIDNELAENSGMIKKVLKYSATGNVEDLGMGEGNTGYIETTLVETPYEVGTVQGRFAYYDEQAMRDDKVVEAGLQGLAETMANDFTAKAINEFEKASKQKSYSTISFDDFVDAIALMNLETTQDEELGLFALVNPAMQAALRKVLKEDLKYVEAFVKTGYIGTCCGVPIYTSKAVPNNTVYIANQKAVTCFIKKNVEAEQERVPNTRQTIAYLRQVALVALTDERYVVKMAKAATTATTITTGTKATKTVAGAATSGSTVYVYINGKLDGSVEAASSAYSYTAKENLVAGDKIIAVSKIKGEVDSQSAEFTVAS